MSITGNVKATTETGKTVGRRMSKDERKSKEQRERIFEAIAAVMAKERSDSITVESIASKIHASRGTIYYYFKTKGEMLYHLYTYGYELVEEAVSSILEDRTLPPRERLERVIRAQARVTCSHWQLWRAMSTDIGLRGAPVELARVVTRRRRKYERMVTELVEEVAQAEGWRCIDAKATTKVILGIIHGISRWYMPKGPLTAEQIVELAVRSAIDGPFEKAPAREMNSSPDEEPVALEEVPHLQQDQEADSLPLSR